MSELEGMGWSDQMAAGASSGALSREQVAEQLCSHASAWSITVAAWSTLSPSQKEFYLVMADWVLAQITQQTQELERVKAELAIEKRIHAKASQDHAEAIDTLAAMTSAVNFLYESKETLLQAFCNLQVTYGEQKHEIRNLKQQLTASQARCREMEREIETLTTCGCEGCDDNLEESAFCFPCMNKVRKQVAQLQATLAAQRANNKEGKHESA